MILGLFVTTLGIAISAISGLGTTPQATLPYVLSLGLPMTLGFWTLVINTVFIIIQWLLLGHRGFLRRHGGGLCLPPGALRL